MGVVIGLVTKSDKVYTSEPNIFRTTYGQESSSYPFLILPCLLYTSTKNCHTMKIKKKLRKTIHCLLYIFVNILTFLTHFGALNLLNVWQKSIPLVAKTMWRKSRLISGSILTVRQRLEAWQRKTSLLRFRGTRLVLGTRSWKAFLGVK